MTYPYDWYDPHRRPKGPGETSYGSMPRHVYAGIERRIKRQTVVEAICVTCGQSPCVDADQEAAFAWSAAHPQTIEEPR